MYIYTYVCMYIDDMYTHIYYLFCNCNTYQYLLSCDTIIISAKVKVHLPSTRRMQKIFTATDKPWVESCSPHQWQIPINSYGYNYYERQCVSEQNSSELSKYTFSKTHFSTKQDKQSNSVTL